MTNPRVSVVMSCYNCEATVKKAIDSILQQTMNDFEFIIIDDGSNDKTLDLLLQFAREDGRIKILQNAKNLGLAASLNKGILEAQAQVIARMDADDVSFVDRFEKQLSILDHNENIDIVGSGIIEQTKDGVEKKTQLLPQAHSDIVKRIFRKPLVYHPTIMIRKRVFLEKGLYNPDIKWAEDADLWYRIYDEVIFYNLQEPLLYYTIKERMSYRQVKYNLIVKYGNLKKRNKVGFYIFLSY